MSAPPARDQQTKDLIRRFQTRRERRRKARLVLAGLGTVVLIALVVVVALLATRGSAGSGEEASATTTLVSGSTTSPGPAPTDPPSTAGSSASLPSTTAAQDVTTTAGVTSTAGVTTTAGVPSTAGVNTTSAVTTTAGITTTTAAPAPTPPTTSRPTGLVVVIDPGHQAKDDSSTEPVGPGSNQLKAKVSSGTAGVVTGTPESELVLAVSLKLRDSLAARGIRVVMTRTTQNVNISNTQRAQMANEAGAHLFVRIHADGSDNQAIAGIHTLYPTSIKGWTDDIAAASKQAAAVVQKELIAATGAKDRGITARSDMTGFNWSDVPVILPEIGFMTNPDEDRRLATAAYQDSIVQGLTRGILAFLGVS